MTITVVFALPAEFSPWRGRHRFRRTDATGRSLYEGQVGPTRVRVALCGVGAPDMQALAETAFTAEVDLVIATGVAGALKPQYRRGEILVAERVRPAGVGPEIVIDDRLVSLASYCGAAIVESFLSVGRPIVLAEKKAQLGCHADAVDMESFAVIGEAEARGVPGVAIRVVGDTVGEDLPLDFARALRRDGTISISRILATAAHRPDRWPALVRFGMSQRRALGGLAGFLDRFVAAL